MNEGFWLSLSAAIGALFAKAADVILKRREESNDATNDIRLELREEIRAITAERNQLVTELIEWKENYYTVLREKNDLSVRIARLERQLKEVTTNE